jgi:hypothetical protein
MIIACSGKEMLRRDGRSGLRTALGHSRRFGCTAAISGLPLYSRHSDECWISSVWANNGQWPDA